MRLVLVDGNNLLVRSIEATRGRPLSSEGGVPTAALLGFINSMAHHVRLALAGDPDAADPGPAVVVCWDGGRSQYRTALSPSYKGNREPRALECDDEVSPFWLARTYLQLSRVQQVVRPGWEADDLIARYCQIRRERGGAPWDEVVIVSSDQDLLQLLDPGVVQLKVTSSRGDADRWDAARVEEAKGCAPRHLPHIMALVGDPGDNVSGLRGIGPRRAPGLMQAAGWDWTRLLASLSPENAATARLAYELVDLRDRPYQQLGLRVSQPAPFRPTAPGQPDWGVLHPWLAQLGLKSVVARLMAGSLWGDPEPALLPADLDL